jgi:hypothetical protein
MFSPVAGAEIAIDTKAVIFHTLDGVQVMGLVCYLYR